MSERALATIRRVLAVDPIEGADNIERLTIDGWQLVSQKGNFRPGDLCLYFEIDSVLPIRPEFEFLRSRCYVKRDWVEGFRIKTIKLRKQVSQGLALPPHEIFKGTFIADEGTDYTEALGVKKWDPPLDPQLRGKARGNFPHFIPKTDQARIQNVYKQYVYKYAEHTFEKTLKLNGSSMTVYVVDPMDSEDDEMEIHVCSRNLELDIENNKDNAFVATALRYSRFFTMPGRKLAFQGELMGPGIQGNREGLDRHEFYIFDIFDIERNRYLLPQERIELFATLSIWGFAVPQHVPILEAECKVLAYNLNSIIEDANSCISIVHPVGEGYVYKSNTDPDVSFKVISNKYLLKEE